LDFPEFKEGQHPMSEWSIVPDIDGIPADLTDPACGRSQNLLRVSGTSFPGGQLVVRFDEEADNKPCARPSRMASDLRLAEAFAACDF
jgi:hypothetical protein